MPKLTIDKREVEVPAGTTILAAAEKLGINIPTLCYAPGMKPLESCFVCAVHIAGHKKFVPSCAMPVHEGMEVVTDSEEVKAARKSALELLLSDHLGECLAPCELACPATWNVPGFMEALQQGDLPAAAAIARAGLVLPGVLGCICTAPCQKACRRNDRDQTVAIRDLHRYAAGAEGVIAPSAPVSGEGAKEPSGRIAIIGSGPAGLAAAYKLANLGYAVTVHEAAEASGGSLRALDASELPPNVLAADIAAVEAAGVAFAYNVPIRDEGSITELAATHDALLLTVGAEADLDGLTAAGIVWTDGVITIDRATHATTVPGIFAAGACAGRKGLAVRVVADGLAAAESIHRYINGESDITPQKPIALRYGSLDDDEQDVLWSRPTHNAPEPGPVDDDTSAVAQAGRCLICGCRDNDLCKLRRLATDLDASRSHYVGERRHLDRDASHPLVAYEPHKCILCGACVAKSESSDGPDALTYVGRGFAARVSGPYEGPIADALGEDGPAYADLCPTSAFHRKTPRQAGRSEAGQ